jgi:cytochrome c-type biogenesis protein
MAALISALWLGILTSISPCPLATNIATISFLSKRVTHPRQVLLAGLAYTLGRMLTYSVLGVFIITSLVRVSFISNFLQRYMNMALGPLLLLMGLFLLGVVRFGGLNISFSEEKKQDLARSGIKGAFALGVMFALSFCPISAALFFGSLIPLALSSSNGILLPFLFGIGTALPVVVVSVCLALGVDIASHWFHRFSNAEKYARKLTGVIFVLVGLYYIWIYLILNILPINK